MATPTQLTVTYLVYSGANPAVITTATAVIPVPASLQTLDSGQTAGSQTGFQALETLLSNIAKRKGVTFADSSGVQNFVPLNMIVKILGA